jgi:hypothetical protein
MTSFTLLFAVAKLICSWLNIEVPSDL